MSRTRVPPSWCFESSQQSRIGCLSSLEVPAPFQIVSVAKFKQNAHRHMKTCPFSYFPLSLCLVFFFLCFLPIFCSFLFCSPLNPTHLVTVTQNKEADVRNEQLVPNVPRSRDHLQYRVQTARVQYDSDYVIHLNIITTNLTTKQSVRRIWRGKAAGFFSFFFFSFFFKQLRQTVYEHRATKAMVWFQPEDSQTQPVPCPEPENNSG